MNFRRIISRRFSHSGDGVDAVADVNAVISANVGPGSGQVTHTSSRQSTRVVQRTGETVASTADDVEEKGAPDDR